MSGQWWQPSRWLPYLRARWVAVVAVAVLLVGGVAVKLAWPEVHVIHVAGLDEPITIRTHQTTLGAALEEQGILVGPKDKVDPPLDTSLKGIKELSVTIRKAFPVTVTIRGESQQVETAAATVGELLEELGVTLEPGDELNLDPATALAAGMEVRVVHHSEEIEVVQEPIPYEILEQNDPYLFIGQRREIQAGEPGIREIRRLVRYEDGVEVASEILEERVIKEPVPQIIAYGTLGIVSRGGTEYRYTRALEMIATGYTAGKESNPRGNGLTYTGLKARRGIVAVDPNVIPLYTRLYVEGYGPALAADIGGAIKGNRIDLCFDTVEEALQWGVRPVTVYILQE